MPSCCLVAAAFFGIGGGLVAAPSPAFGASAWWHLGTVARPGLDASTGEAEIAFSAINLGDAPAGGSDEPIALLATLPQGVAVRDVSGVTGVLSKPVNCSIESERSVSCALGGAVVPYDQIEVQVGVDLVDGGEQGSGKATFVVSGGGAPPAALERDLFAQGDPDRLGVAEFELRPEEAGGDIASRAGSHPFQVTAAFALTQTAEASPTAPPKDMRLRLPAGLLADANAVSRCSPVRFREGACPLTSVVGVGTFAVNEPALLGLARVVAPIFNLEPAGDQPARFGALPIGVPFVIDSSIQSGDAAELSIRNIPRGFGLLGATVTLWGAPADALHDDARGLDCLMAARGFAELSCLRLEDPEPGALLTMPTSCDGPAPRSDIEVVPWENGLPITVPDRAFPQVGDCERVPFQPLAEATTSSASSASPSGLELEIGGPGEGLRNPAETAESAIRRIRVTLPEGTTINPAVANGLSLCGRAGYEAESLRGRGCPDAAKIGALAIASPIFNEPLSGSAYLGAEEGERFDGSLDLYLVARNPGHGLLVKLQAQLRLDHRTGRIEVVADRLPQLPLSSLRLSLPQGRRALLATPSHCGATAIEMELTPYSAPAASVGATSPLTISSGPGGGPCSQPILPFQPQLEAGTLDNMAAAYSPFYLRVSRFDGEAALDGLSLSLPPGLAANSTGVETCSPAKLAAAAKRTGAEEAAAPSCPAGATVGRTRIGAGVGPAPSYVAGNLYLAGPDRGAPFSIAAVTPVRFGPLDLGTVVRRFPVEVNPRTGQLKIEFPEDQRLPSMIDGIALHLRDLRLYFDRPGFILNPSGCEPAAIRGLAYTLDGRIAPLTERFQAADCARLPFKPSLSLRLTGAQGRNGHPGLRATIRSDGREAHLAAFRFTLPPGQLLDFHHLRALCGRAVSVRGCPAASRLGRARLRSPLLDKPLRGPIYLRQPVRGLPDLVADLRSEGVRIALEGHTAAPSGRLRVSFPSLPDLPLSSGTIVLQGGRRGLLANSESLCRNLRRAEAVLSSHSGKSRWYRPRLALEDSC